VNNYQLIDKPILVAGQGIGRQRHTLDAGLLADLGQREYKMDMQTTAVRAGLGVLALTMLLAAGLDGPTPRAAASSARAVEPVPPVPIQQQSPTAAAALPGFIGTVASPHPFYEPPAPRHPFMAANGSSEIHDDAYQSDTYQTPGPLGDRMQVLSTQLNGECASVTFDRSGRIVTVCVGPTGPVLVMIDAVTLATLATFPLPARQPSAAAVNIFTGFSGGGYFYLDAQDRAVIPTTTRHIYVVAEGGATGFQLVHDYDVSSVLASGDSITSALPDWSGRIWFESFSGVLGTIDPQTGAVRTRDLGEETENSFAVDEHNAVYVVSIKAQYRLHADPQGVPTVDWRSVYPNSGVHQPGQVDAGSGTTPTVQGDYVTITDNADPIDVVAYRRDNGQEVCRQPVFGKGDSADENSVIGAGTMMIVENNHGYTGPTAVEGGAVTSPGIERVDIDPGRGCHVVWINGADRVPTSVSKVSFATGLLYAYTKEDTSPSDAWYFTALDAGTGRVVYQRLAGTGLGFNNNYAPITLGPDGTAYVGVLGGLVALRDAVAPHLPPPSPPASRPGSGAPPASTPPRRPAPPPTGHPSAATTRRVPRAAVTATQPRRTLAFTGWQSAWPATGILLLVLAGPIAWRRRGRAHSA